MDERLILFLRKLLSKEPLAEKDLCEVLNLSKKELRGAIEELQQMYGVEVSRIKSSNREYFYYIDTVKKFNTPENEYVIRAKNPVRIGIVSDTHLGSKYDMITELWDFYEKTKDYVDFYLHSGDIIDGMNIYHGQVYALRPEAIGLKAQVEYLEKNYPYVGKPTYFIRGNHDLDKHNKDVNPVLLMQSRDDLVYLGDYYREVLIKDRKGNSVKIALVHGDGGGAYAISYKAQAYLRGTNPNERAEMYVFGHWHKAGVFWYEGNLLFLAGCMQRDNDFSTRKGLNGDRLCSVVEIHYSDRHIDRINYTHFKYK